MGPILPLHIAAILILLAFFIGFRYGISRDERRREKERSAIWKREQEKLPKAYRQ
jgi:preprotein translocase subunit YajC